MLHFPQEKNNNQAIEEDVKMVQEVLKSEKFIFLDLCSFSIFFIAMLFIFPAPVYIFISSLFAIYMMICLFLYFQNKKAERRHS